MQSFVRTYRYELRPTASQATRLEHAAHARRFVWNWGLERRQEYWRRTGTNLTWTDLSRELTSFKRTPAGRWLTAVDSQALQQALRDLYHAYRSYFRGHSRLPRFKSRKSDPLRFRIPQRISIEGDRLIAPNLGPIRLRLSRVPCGRLSSATFARDPTGKWFVHVVSHFRPDPVPVPDTATGIDLGIRNLVTLSDGSTVPNPRFLRAASRRLRREHRSLSRKQPGGRNRARQRKRLAAAHAKVARKRRDFLHKVTSRLIMEHGVLCIEDLNVRGLARTKLSKDIADASFRELRRQLTYKAAWRNRTIVEIDRFAPSSKTCSCCGEVEPALMPSAITWICPRCGVTHDRDENAARNILGIGMAQLAAAGHADAENACGASVSLRAAAAGAEAGTRR